MLSRWTICIGLGKCYSQLNTVSTLNQVANRWFLCEESGCFNKFTSISQYQLFKFGRKFGTEKWKEGTVHFLVRGTVDDTWNYLPTGGGPSLLRFVVYITKTPP